MAYHADELEKRVAKLEQHHAENMSALAVLTDRHDAAAIRLTKIEDMLQEIRDRVMAWRDCPDPGACVSLRASVESVQDEIAKIKTDRAIVVGGWRLIGIIGAGVMAVGAAAYSLWLFIEKLVHRHQP